jgi:hypothetical protein
MLSLPVFFIIKGSKFVLKFTRHRTTTKMQQPQILVLKEGTENAQGKQQVTHCNQQM